MNLKVKHFVLINGMEVVAKINVDSNWENDKYVELVDACFMSINVLSDLLPESLNIPRVSIAKMNPFAKIGEHPRVRLDHIITVVNVDPIIANYYESAFDQLNKKHSAAREALNKGKLAKKLPEVDILEDDLEDDIENEAEEDNELFQEFIKKKKYVN